MPNTIRKPYIVGMGPIPRPLSYEEGNGERFCEGFGFLWCDPFAQSHQKAIRSPFLVGTGGAYNERSE